MEYVIDVPTKVVLSDNDVRRIIRTRCEAIMGNYDIINGKLHRCHKTVGRPHTLPYWEEADESSISEFRYEQIKAAKQCMRSFELAAFGEV